CMGRGELRDRRERATFVVGSEGRDVEVEAAKAREIGFGKADDLRAARRCVRNVSFDARESVVEGSRDSRGRKTDDHRNPFSVDDCMKVLPRANMRRGLMD